jgi:uncharacterized protein YegJ (DUF2314 family)
MRQLHVQFATHAVFVAALVLTGCDGQDRSASSDSAGAQTDRPPSPWSFREGAAIVSVSEDQDDPNLVAAIAKARATSAEARQNWLKADETQRQNWYIKWAAPTADQSVEHVWVQPINWSQFRVEGRLVNAPVRELIDGKAEGDVVSFPIEELSDWIHAANATSGAIDFNAPYEGGYTVKLLQQKFGSPRR